MVYVFRLGPKTEEGVCRADGVRARVFACARGTARHQSLKYNIHLCSENKKKASKMDRKGKRCLDTV